MNKHLAPMTIPIGNTKIRRAVSKDRKEYFIVDRELKQDRANVRAREYYQENKEIIKQKRRERYKENTEKEKQEAREYYQNNKEGIQLIRKVQMFNKLYNEGLK